MVQKARACRAVQANMGEHTMNRFDRIVEIWAVCWFFVSAGLTLYIWIRAYIESWPQPGPDIFAVGLLAGLFLLFVTVCLPGMIYYGLQPPLREPKPVDDGNWPEW